MNIDYDQAMKVRAVVHAGIEEELAEKQAKKDRLKNATVAAHKDDTKEYRPVLMAIATSGQGVINQHFGHATEFLIYEASSKGVRFVSHRKVDQYCVGNDECGEKESALAGSIRALKGCEVVLCSKIGYEPWGLLEEAGIQPNGEYAMEPIDEAVQSVYEEMIANGALENPAPTAELAEA